MRGLLATAGILAMLAGLFMLWVIPATPISEPGGVAYASLYLMVVVGSSYALIVCAPRN